MNELWEDSEESVFVYLFTQDNPPSFKIPSHIIDASPTLKALAYNNNTSVGQLQTLSEHSVVEEPRDSLSIASPIETSDGNEIYSPLDQVAYGNIPNPLIAPPPRDGHLSFPSVQLDLFANSNGAGEQDRVIAARNMFAFLTQKPLIATKRLPTEFEVFFSIANHLEELGFLDERIGDYGLAASTAFKGYMDKFALQDIRGNPAKILKGLVLGEKMRSTELYYDSFTHLVGYYRTVRKEKSGLYDMISKNTRYRIERENHDLEMRQGNVNTAMQDFDFPHIFNGHAQSKMTAESRVVRFSAWKQHFGYFRSFTLSYYKHLYGSWPPKANKKNHLTTDGLSRVVLQQLYQDLCVLYDLIVDRESYTTRKLDVEEDGEEEVMTEHELEILALRKIMSEHDRAMLPLSPPMPFDLPRLPSMSTIDAAFDTRTVSEQQLEESRKLKYFETTLIMAKAHNMDQGIHAPFLQQYATFEQKESAGKSLKELRDMRIGHWLFLYAVLQRLPLLVVDAPNLKCTENVEYFLCKSPIGPPPWLEGTHGLKPHTDEVAENTAEGIFYRSHCWIVGSKMLQDIQTRNPPILAHDVYAESPYLDPVNGDFVPDFSLNQNYQDMPQQQAWQGEQEYLDAPQPQRNDSVATQSTITSLTRQSTVPDLSIRTRSQSHQRRTISQPLEYMMGDPYGGGTAFNSNSAPVSPGGMGMGMMRPASRSSSGYFGPGGIASRPVSRSGYMDEDYGGRRFEGVPSSLGRDNGSAVWNTNGTTYGQATTPPLTNAESGSRSGSGAGGSVIDPAGSVMGGSVAGGRSVSQTRAVRMGPSTFDDILEGMEKNGGSKKQKKPKDKMRSRMSIFGGSGMGGSSQG